MQVFSNNYIIYACVHLYYTPVCLCIYVCIYGCRYKCFLTLQLETFRRNVQNVLIDTAVIEWLLKILEDPDNLSDYGLEYTVALLMNLCLRTSGKSKLHSHFFLESNVMFCAIWYHLYNLKIVRLKELQL